MGTRILDGVKVNECDKPGAVFYDSVTGFAFGPMFDSADDAEKFMSFMHNVDLSKVLDWGQHSQIYNLYDEWLRIGKPDSRPCFQFDDDYLSEDEEDGSWHFQCHFVETCFPIFSGYNNHDVFKILSKANIFSKKDSADSEHSCIYVTFKTEKQGKEFINRLNKWLTDNWTKNGSD
jgi:hypothetical protein